LLYLFHNLIHEGAPGNRNRSSASGNNCSERGNQWFCRTNQICISYF